MHTSIRICEVNEPGNFLDQSSAFLLLDHISLQRLTDLCNLPEVHSAMLTLLLTYFFYFCSSAAAATRKSIRNITNFGADMTKQTAQKTLRKINLFSLNTCKLSDIAELIVRDSITSIMSLQGAFTHDMKTISNKRNEHLSAHNVILLMKNLKYCSYSFPEVV